MSQQSQSQTIPMYYEARVNLVDSNQVPMRHARCATTSGANCEHMQRIILVPSLTGSAEKGHSKLEWFWW